MSVEGGDLIIQPEGRRATSTPHNPWTPQMMTGKQMKEWRLQQQQEPLTGMHPLMTKAGGQTQYVPWTVLDMVSLAACLPDLTEGANKWITKLEETIAGKKLALRNTKALVMHTADKQVTVEHF